MDLKQRLPSFVSRAILAFHSLQQGEDGHRMPVTQVKIILQPFDDCSRFDPSRELTLARESLFLSERPEVSRAFAWMFVRYAWYDMVVFLC